MALWRVRETYLASQVFERTDRRLRVVDVCGNGLSRQGRAVASWTTTVSFLLAFSFFSPVTVRNSSDLF